jgi:hypothetical protein
VFTQQDIIDKVREIAAAEPDTVYVYLPGQGACTYTPGVRGAQRCLIGRALSALGVPDIFFMNCNMENYSKIVSCLVGAGYLPETWGASLEPDEWLIRAQFMQDSGVNWGRAVRMVDNPLEPW